MEDGTPEREREGRTKRGWKARPLALAALAALGIGALYYLLFRGADTPLGSLLAPLRPDGLSRGGGATLSDPTGGTLPSFLHTLALTWLTLALGGPARRVAALAALVLVLALGGELLVGTFDPGDIVACLLGSAAALLSGRAVGGARHALPPCPTSPGHHGPWRGGGVLVALSLLFVTGTSPQCGGGSCNSIRGNGLALQRGEPVYLSYEDLRGAVKREEPRPIGSIGRLYVYGDRLFLNRRNEGIHVLDNTDPTAPVNVAFIAVPGNTELELRGANLYADSYVDLVTIDLASPDYAVLDREENVFPYDEYQNVPEEIYFVDVDGERGVVIGHE